MKVRNLTAGGSVFVQPLRRAIWKYLVQLKVPIFCDSETPPLDTKLRRNVEKCFKKYYLNHLLHKYLSSSYQNQAS